MWRETNINSYVLPQGFNTYTDYLLSLSGVQVGATNYRFELGSTTDAVGLRTPTNTACTTSSPICIVNLNTINNSEAALAPITAARNALSATLNRAYNNSLQQVEQVSSIGRSVYEGLTFEIRRGFRNLGKGLRGSVRFAYTFSRLRDDGIVNTSSAQIPGDFASEFGTSIQDRRHYFKFSGTVEVPEWLGKIRFSPYLRLGSGRPFNLSNGGFDRSLDDVSGDRPNFTGDLNLLKSRKPGESLPAGILDNLSYAPIGSPGNLPRNAGRGPKLFLFDLNLSREFRFSERFRLRPNVEFDNIFNATTFTFSSDFINFNNINTADFQRDFLVPQRTYRPRQIRFGMRFDF